MPGTSDNNTGNTSARQQPSYAHNQAMSAPAGEGPLGCVNPRPTRNQPVHGCGETAALVTGSMVIVN